MKNMNLPAFVCAVLFVAVSCQSVDAQRPAHYVPARQTFSNYLLYRQINGTGIPNYYSFVRPAQQSRDFASRAQVFDSRAGRQSLTVQQEVARAIESQLTQRPFTGVGRAAVPAQFGETTHFYRRPPIRRR